MSNIVSRKHWNNLMVFFRQYKPLRNKHCEWYIHTLDKWISCSSLKTLDDILWKLKKMALKRIKKVTIFIFVATRTKFVWIHVEEPGKRCWSNFFLPDAWQTSPIVMSFSQQNETKSCSDHIIRQRKFTYDIPRTSNKHHQYEKRRYYEY